MSRTNISFNNKNYQIDDASLSAASSALRNHLSTVMNGSGATITLGGVAYSIDAAKLSAEEDKFAAYLGTIGGEITEEERLEGDGAEYYTLAPTALSFRSTAPLNELQEVQINGVAVDPANYTLEEGSTIVTFPIEYLKTLNVGNYEVTVSSESKAVKGDFTVKAPELNEHGFYYNQPYVGYVSAVGYNWVFFFRTDNTIDVLVPSTGYVEIASYTADNKTMCVTRSTTGAIGNTFNGTFSDDGSEVYCVELATTFKLANSTAIVADEDYIYIYNEELGGYEVTAIYKKKAEYGDIKTGINGIDTVALADGAFEYNSNLIFVPKIPNSVKMISDSAFEWCDGLKSITIPSGVTSIEAEAFWCCVKLADITFEGTMTQWNAITKGTDWNGSVPATYVQCSDGQVAL